MSEQALLVFVKNIQLGKVKTRLAATIGPQRAMEIYQQLVAHTQKAATRCKADVFVFYSDATEANDGWPKTCCKVLQQGSDLGERMNNAFEFVFEKGYAKAIIIGTDCPEITTGIITDAFAQLTTHDVAMGPAADGGYYLLGLRRPQPHLFANMAWSTNTVCSTTLERCRQSGLSFRLLPLLHDVDEEKDLPYLSAIT